MTLYHGSNAEIGDIDLNISRPFKDFGRGFYTTATKEHALGMAQRTCVLYGGTPCLTVFEFDKGALNNAELSVNVFKTPTEDWAYFVMNNRNRKFSDITSQLCNTDNKYDIVFGLVANDNLVYLFRDFERGRRDITSLVNGLIYKELSTQYSFHTKKAIALLRKIGVENV